MEVITIRGFQTFHLSNHFHLNSRLDSPKLRNKGQKVNKSRPGVNLRRQSTSAGGNRKIGSTSGTLVVVNRGGSIKDAGIEKDPDIVRLQVGFVMKQFKFIWLKFSSNCFLNA